MITKKYFLIFFFVASFFSLSLLPAQRIYSRERLITADDYTIDVFYAPVRQALTQDYEIYIASNGSVTVSNKDYYSAARSSPKIIVKSGTLSDEKLKAFKKMILEINVFRFNDEYIGSPSPLGYCGDELRITVNGKTKKILLSASSFPVELGQVLRRIDEIKTEINNS